MDINFYTINCPKCGILKKKLDRKNLSYETIEGVDAIKELGFTSAPILSVDGKAMKYEDAVHFIDSL